MNRSALIYRAPHPTPDVKALRVGLAISVTLNVLLAGCYLSRLAGV